MIRNGELGDIIEIEVRKHMFQDVNLLQDPQIIGFPMYQEYPDMLISRAVSVLPYLVHPRPKMFRELHKYWVLFMSGRGSGCLPKRDESLLLEF
jgi:hypothetical protein